MFYIFTSAGCLFQHDQPIFSSVSLYPDQVDDSHLGTLFSTLNLGGNMDFLLASLIHQYWHEEDVTFGNRIRAGLSKIFLEASQIEALWKNETLEIISGQPRKKSSGQAD